MGASRSACATSTFGFASSMTYITSSDLPCQLIGTP
jgi:hypothetical protein